jgi:hypothetical protein
MKTFKVWCPADTVGLGFDRELSEAEAETFYDYARDEEDPSPESDASESADNLSGSV